MWLVVTCKLVVIPVGSHRLGPLKTKSRHQDKGRARFNGRSLSIKVPNLVKLLFEGIWLSINMPTVIMLVFRGMS